MREASAEEDMRTNMTNEETTKAAAVAEQDAHVAPEKGTSKKVPSKKKGAPKGQKTAKSAKPKKTAKPARKAAAPRAESKGAQILALIRRPKGATLAELAKVTGWQNHSIRGFLSGSVGKKMGLAVESTPARPVPWRAFSHSAPSPAQSVATPPTRRRHSRSDARVCGLCAIGAYLKKWNASP